MKNVFSYRLASKYLTTTGALILSASERDFLKLENPDIMKEIGQEQPGPWHPSTELIDAQVTYLGVTVGERDHTDLNSWSLVAMSREWLPEHTAYIAGHYCEWAAGRELPMPGSFAVFKRKTGQFQRNYLEYI